MRNEDVSSQHLILPATAGMGESAPRKGTGGIPKYPLYIFSFHFSVLTQLNRSESCHILVSFIFKSFFVLYN